MKHFLVPTDFSKTADIALEFAAQSAKHIPATITIVHAFELVNNMYVDYSGAHREFHEDLTREIQKKLDRLKQDVQKRHDVKINTLLAKEHLDKAILNITEEKNIDMIIMGTLGASGIKSKLWGSRTSSVISSSPVPVMTIPHSYYWEKPGAFLLATNQFERSKPILDYIFELAGLYLATVHTAVFTSEEEDKAGTYIRHEKEIEEYEQFLKEEYKEDSLSSAHLYGDNFEDSIENYIQEHDINLLVMITRQKSFWRNLFDPSITQQMSFHTKVPLLAIPESYRTD